jgi:gamma-glutamylcyclotransferase
MVHDADRNFPHSKNESNSPTVDFETLNNQLSTTSFSHSAAASCRDHSTPRFLRIQKTVTLDRGRTPHSIDNTDVVFRIRFKYGLGADEATMPISKVRLRAKLPAHRLAFTLKSARRDCGVADVLPDQAKEVRGVVYELEDNELNNLDKREDYRPGKPYDQSKYTREDHYVLREGDAKQPLLVALYRGHPQLDPPLPSDDYKELIVDGAKRWELPADYIQELESIQTV